MIADQSSQLPLFQPFSKSGAVVLFRDTWRAVLLGWRVLVPLLLILTFIPVIQFSIEFDLSQGYGEIGSWITVFFDFLRTFCSWLTAVAVVVATDATSERRSVSLWKAYSTAARRFWPYIVTLVLVNLIALEGSVLLVVPGLLLALALYPAIYATIIEGLRPREALARSHFLTNGQKGSILGSVVLFWIFCLALLWIPLIVVVGYPDWRWIELPPVNVIWGPGSDSLDPDWFPYVMVPGEAIWTLLFSVFMVLVFKSLRAERGEGITSIPLWPAAVFIAIGVALSFLSLLRFVETKTFVERAVPATGTLIAPTATSYWGGAITLQSALRQSSAHPTESSTNCIRCSPRRA
ncbi:hypothetical protein G5V57_13200 [Nordella sp. HKS 07]|uniref:hypothetical protein n=1 Tax=Nordella sp. HKS 07 TaxID=2712222 RepID=UPI0013E11083|nr:hypothetical protein [Nordella sp. HKS 07]QIG48598.1 hypothetical protein G5V57_13200 [Nordella sp. HKS 07]